MTKSGVRKAGTGQAEEERRAKVSTPSQEAGLSDRTHLDSTLRLVSPQPSCTPHSVRPLRPSRPQHPPPCPCPSPSRPRPTQIQTPQVRTASTAPWLTAACSRQSCVRRSLVRTRRLLRRRAPLRSSSRTWRRPVRVLVVTTSVSDQSHGVVVERERVARMR